MERRGEGGGRDRRGANGSGVGRWKITGKQEKGHGRKRSWRRKVKSRNREGQAEAMRPEDGWGERWRTEINVLWRREVCPFLICCRAHTEASRLLFCLPADRFVNCLCVEHLGIFSFFLHRRPRLSIPFPPPRPAAVRLDTLSDLITADLIPHLFLWCRVQGHI